MVLPSRPKKEPRTEPVTVRLSKQSADQLRTLAREHNISQADVIEHLLEGEYSQFQRRKGLLTAAEPGLTKKSGGRT